MTATPAPDAVEWVRRDDPQWIRDRGPSDPRGSDIQVRIRTRWEEPRSELSAPEELAERLLGLLPGSELLPDDGRPPHRIRGHQLPQLVRMTLAGDALDAAKQIVIALGVGVELDHAPGAPMNCVSWFWCGTDGAYCCSTWID